MDTRDSKGRFIKGNPGGGRPKKQPTTRELLQEISPQAVARLGDLIHSGDEAVALQASFDILELVLKYDVSINEAEKEKYERAIKIRDFQLERTSKSLEILRDFFKEQTEKGLFANLKEAVKYALGIDDSIEQASKQAKEKMLSVWKD